MDFEKCWQALANKAYSKGMDITTPGETVELTTENLKALLEQFHAQGVMHGTSRQKAADGLGDLFGNIFGGRR